MKIAMLLKCDNGMYALNDAELQRLKSFANKGFIEELKRLEKEGKKPSEGMLEFSELLDFLKYPYREDV